MSNKRKEPYSQLYHLLGFYPDKIGYYRMALRHKSVEGTSDKGYAYNNERLEFLGDAVFNSVVTDILFKRYEHQQEGFLTDTRSKLVKRNFLNQLALDLGLDGLLMKSKHVASHNNSNIYGNAFEALIGAIYLDQGYKQCKKFVEKRLLNVFIDLDQVIVDENNYKSKIIEFCQKYHLPYEYELLEDELLSPNAHLFKTRLVINGIQLAESEGRSKKESQQQASLIAYTKIVNDSSTLKMLTEIPMELSEIEQ